MRISSAETGSANKMFVLGFGLRSSRQNAPVENLLRWPKITEFGGDAYEREFGK